MAFLDVENISTDPECLQQAYGGVELWRHARIPVDEGKTQVWNSRGNRLSSAMCWNCLPKLRIHSCVEGIWGAHDRSRHRVLGHHWGTQITRKTLDDHQLLLNRIPGDFSAQTLRTPSCQCPSFNGRVGPPECHPHTWTVGPVVCAW